MILVTHALISTVITKPIESNLLIFGAAFLTHFVFDMIPHYHYDISAVTNVPEGKNKFFAVLKRFSTFSFFKITVDVLAAFILPFLILGAHGYQNPLPILLAISGAILPDFLEGLYWMGFPSKLLSAYHSFHLAVHLKMGDIFTDTPVLGNAFNFTYTAMMIYAVFAISRGFFDLKFLLNSSVAAFGGILAVFIIYRFFAGKYKKPAFSPSEIK